MALTLSCSVTESQDATEGGKTFTAYVVECKTGDSTWTVLKRYSQFHDLKTRMEKETIRPNAPFPAKKFGSLSVSAQAQRREQLDAYMSELSASFLPEHVYEVLCQFLEVQQHTQGAPAAAPAAAAPAAEPDPAPAAAETPTAGGGQTWNADWMDHDPLAGMMGAAPAPAPEPSATEAAPAPEPAPAPAPAAEAAPPVPASPPAALPAFLAHSQNKTYAATGEGLRDAIKNGDVKGVKQVLAADSSCASYKDRQDQSMLHLAAIFNHTEIAELLLAAGADPTVRNSENETAIDVAAPTLKRKMKAVANVAA